MCGPSSSLSSLHVCRSVDCLPQKHSLQFQCFFLFYSYSDSLFYILLPASVFLPFFFLPLDFSTCVSLSDTCVLLPSCINSPCLALVLFGRCFCSVVASVPSWLFQFCFFFFFSINLPFWFLIIVFPFEEGCEDAVDWRSSCEAQVWACHLNACFYLQYKRAHNQNSFLHSGPAHTDPRQGP